MTPNTRVWCLSIIAPVIYAVCIRYIFDAELFIDYLAVMSVTFLVCLPFGMGFLTIALSDTEQIRSKKYRIFMPWLPIVISLVLTILVKVEGWACWLMILPIFLIFSSLGGLLAGYYILRSEERKDRLNISIVLVIPFILGFPERQLPIPAITSTADTHIDIQAPAAAIWGNVVRVRTISSEEDHGTLTNWLGFPRPVKAELDYAGIGGCRLAIFTGGLVFKEVVTAYQSEKKMQFTIRANPYDIPSTTMDRHIVIGGDYFDVLDGTYELQQLDAKTCRLHLYSHFTIKTTFNFYANWWAEMIMRDIQSNILEVIRTRSEAQL